MLSNDSAETPQQASSLSDAQNGGVEVSLMKPDDPIEVTSGGTTTVNDPPPPDTKPPGNYGGLDHFLV